MNRLLFILIFIFSLNFIHAQFSPKTNGYSSFARFIKTDTYFVLTGNEKIDAVIKEEVAKNWTITPFRFLPADSFLLVSKDRDKSFVYINKMKQMGNGKFLKTIALVNGGYDEKATYYSNTLAYISIDNEGYEANEEDVMYRYGHLLIQLQDIVEIEKEENLVGSNEEDIRAKFIKLYNKRCGALQEKTLLIDRRYLSQKIISETELMNLYKFNVSFVSKQEIEKAIQMKDASKAYLVSALNLFKINTITDCETGKIIYLDFNEEDPITKDFIKTFDRDDIIQLNGHVKIGK